MKINSIILLCGLIAQEALFGQCPTSSKPVTIAGDDGVILSVEDGQTEFGVPVGNGYASGTHPLCGSSLYATFLGSFGTKKEEKVGVTEIKYQMEILEKSFSGSTWKKVAESFTETKAASSGTVRYPRVQCIVKCGHIYKGIIKFKVRRNVGGWAADWDRLTTNTWNIYECVPPAGIQVSLNKEIGDFNGDGKTDLLFFGEGVVSVSLNKGNKFSSVPAWLGANCGVEKYWIVGDFNGDKKDDLLSTYNGQGVKVFLSDGISSFRPGEIWTTAGNGTKGWYVGKFNNDLFDDIFRVETAGVHVFVSDGISKFIDKGIWTPAGEGDIGWQVGNFNGDNYDDLLRVNNGMQVLLSNGTSFQNPVTWFFPGHGLGMEQQWTIGKFNNDASDDLFRTRMSSGFELEVATSGPNTFGPMFKWGKVALMDAVPLGHIGDFNGDGRTDVLKIGTGVNYNGKYLIYFSNGVNFNSPVAWGL